MKDATERLETLRAGGGAAYDGPGFRFIEGLVRRAAELDGAAERRLLERARQRLDSFEAELEAARGEATEAMESLESAGVDPKGELRAAFDRGDLRAVLRRADRALRLARDDGARAAQRRQERLARQVRARGIVLPADLRERLDGASPFAAREARTLGDSLAKVLFRDAAEQARSSLVVARATDQLPDEVGPYNAAALSVQALGLMEAISPGYLRAYLAGLEELSALRALPEPPKRRRRR